MQNNADNSLEQFNKILGEKWAKLSESDTRAKIIDPIFKDCLGWDESDITREENTDSGFIDYIFRDGIRPLFIIEAKKEGKSFEIPEERTNRKFALNGIISKEKNLMIAIEQAQKYCIDKGSNISIISNGHQFVIFEAFKVGKPWREGKCIIFNGIKDLQSNYHIFYNYLNKNSVLAGSLHKILSDKTNIINYTRALEGIPNKDALLTRNYLNQYISPFTDFVFEDIIEQKQINILKECYIFEKTDQETHEGIRKIFADLVPYYEGKDNIKSFYETEKSAGKFEEHVRSSQEKSDIKGRLILLLGGIGSGKTTFLHRFFNVILDEIVKKSWFYVDFKTAPIDKDKLEDYVFDKIIKNFESRYYEKVKFQIEKSGINLDKNNPEKYVKSIFSILSWLNYSNALVFDNVDQLDEEMQEIIFLLAQNLTYKLDTLTILALREESYYRSQLTGAFGAYHLTKFHISAPNFEKLILSRIEGFDYPFVFVN